MKKITQSAERRRKTMWYCATAGFFLGWFFIIFGGEQRRIGDPSAFTWILTIGSLVGATIFLIFGVWSSFQKE